MNEKDQKSGMTALHYATAGGRLELVVELLVQGADIKIPDNNGNTALHYATTGEHRCLVEVLLKYGADPSVPNQNGLVPVEMTRNPYITELFMRDKGNIFSPMVQARQLFGEYLDEHQSQSQAKSQAKSGRSHQSIDSVTVQPDTTVSHLNLEDEFSVLSIQSPSPLVDNK